MRSFISLFLVLSLSMQTVSVISHENYFKHQNISSGFLRNESKISYYVGTNKVGYISYTKIPFVHFYALHSFYVYPSYRNKGDGKRILNYASEYLTSLGAQRIYIQPGPFEIDSDGRLDRSDPSYELKLQRLVRFYKDNGFVVVNRWLSYFVNLLYKCMSIDENADYLIVRVVH